MDEITYENPEQLLGYQFRGRGLHPLRVYVTEAGGNGTSETYLMDDWDVEVTFKRKAPPFADGTLIRSGNILILKSGGSWYNIIRPIAGVDFDEWDLTRFDDGDMRGYISRGDATLLYDGEGWTE